MLMRRDLARAREMWSGRKVAELSEDEMAAAHRAGYESGGDGWLVGRDPREMVRPELEALGFGAMSLMEALRARCLDCCGGEASEVRKCVSLACPSWPFRMGKNPWREISEARRETGRRLAAERWGKSENSSQGLSGNSGEGEG